MTTEELIGYLQKLPADAEIRLAVDPDLPSQSEIGGMVVVDMSNVHDVIAKVERQIEEVKHKMYGTGAETDELEETLADLYEELKTLEESTGLSVVVYFVERAVGYLPRNVREEIGW